MNTQQTQSPPDLQFVRDHIPVFREMEAERQFSQEVTRRYKEKLGYKPLIINGRIVL